MERARQTCVIQASPTVPTNVVSSHCPILSYLARYTHRIAISNDRLLRLEGDHVVFTWRDRAHGDRRRTMRLYAHEFLRRFLLHVLPDSFVSIRSYRLLANRNRHANLTRCREAV